MPCIDCGEPSRGKRCLACEKARRIREAKGWTDPKTGRVWIRALGHPRAQPKRGHYVLRAILVLEQKIGRYLNWPYEVAHHINDDKGDDRPENLEVRTRSIHTGHHKTKFQLSPESLIQMYHTRGMSLEEIGEEVGAHLTTIQKAMKRHGIPLRRSGPRRRCDKYGKP